MSNELDLAALGGPFDLAYTRCFLMHQSDTARTLARIADIVRPGWLDRLPRAAQHTRAAFASPPRRAQ